MSFILQDSAGSIDVTVPANQSIAVFTRGKATVSRSLTVGNPFPPEEVVIGQVVNTQQIFGPFSTTLPTTISLDNLAKLNVFYNVGTAPRVEQDRLPTVYNFSAGALNATGTLTFELCVSGVVTSTTAAAVTATLDTGAVLDTKTSLQVGEGFDWSVINTGGTNAFTVTASSGHTIVGGGAVAANNSGAFRTVRTAAATYVTYRLAS